MGGVKAVFFDRDGVLNEDTGYLHRMADLQWVTGALSAVARLKREGWRLFVVTNQSGVARGYYTEDDVKRLHEEMNDAFRKAGGAIDAFYYCPYLKGAPLARYDRDSEDRKPRPGMILRAMAEWHVDPKKAFLFGDSPRDVEAAEAAGIKGFLFDGTDLDAFIQARLPEEP